MSLSSAKAMLDAQGGDPVTGYISKADVQGSYDELVDGTALTGTTTIAALTLAGVTVGSGSGSPEGTVAAPVGSVWTDKAVTTGASLWVKVTGTGNTGWAVAHGDTGVRLLASWNAAGAMLTGSMPAGLEVVTGAAGYVTIRRVNNTVMVQWYNCKIAIAAAAHITFPTGFIPAPQLGGVYALGLTAALYRHPNFVATLLLPAGAGGAEWWFSTGLVGDVCSGEVTAITDAAWPTALPGS